MSNRVYGNSSSYNPGTASNPYDDRGGGSSWMGGNAAGINQALGKTGSNYRIPQQAPAQQQAPQYGGLVDRGGGQITSQGANVPVRDVQIQAPEEEKKQSGFNWQSILGMLL
ncbi:MAG: hypothetical protein RLZZ450_310 [Pseudomonadota bacterium]|jgi:hypothetical protein